VERRAKPFVVGLVLGLAVVLAFAGYAAYRISQAPSAEEADKILAIGLAEDVDGAQVAALVAVVDTGSSDLVVEAVDPLADVGGTGSSYTQLKDQYPFGGGDAVAAGVAELTGDEQIPWIVVPADQWIDLVDAAGGIEANLAEGTNAYVRGELFIVESGEQVLSGGQSYAVAASTISAEATSAVLPDVEPLAAGLAAALAAGWDAVVSAVEDGSASSSLDAETLQNLGI
jgi:hypothetical protein